MNSEENVTKLTQQQIEEFLQRRLFFFIFLIRVSLKTQ